ncbi:DUF2911 domain-containing protein [Xanthovirga aplysinae]|uniref:DUF2911 domain-containing protein n=1 Tax=Xanthovirga aplysinae TaxID=2529853 RepID=UPI0012BD5EF4|nr:DUF2911 domain-containing protein [Xanthovirga aplysinae]MTI31587.1 DUF2911 domain-containing protein [Xanthovirga aplysinae]
MKKYFLTIAGAFLLFACSSKNNETSQKQAEHSDHKLEAGHHHGSNQHGEEKEEKAKPLSPHTSAMGMIGNNHVHIDYSSPGKRGRMIFGGLVGFGQVWSTGAHKATNITFDKDVKIDNVDIPAGKYGLFTIPDQNEWTIILNKDWDMHLADEYNKENDIVRVKAIPQQLKQVVESLTFEVKETGNEQGKVTIQWDQTAVSFDIKNSK